MTFFPPVYRSIFRAYPRRNPAALRRGFTLIELLVVIAIIGVLAGILLVVLQKVRAKADQVTCANQQKQIGVAIMNYAQDNNQTLPGPVYAGQPAYFNINMGYGAMLTWIYPYLGFSTPDNTMRRGDVFICPAFQKQIPVKDGNPRPYCVSGRGTYGGGNSVEPFGYPGDLSPFKLNMFKNYSTSSIMTDLDGQLSASYAGKPTIAPATPIHGATRNWLFLDGHVEVSSQNLFNLDN